MRNCVVGSFKYYYLLEDLKVLQEEEGVETITSQDDHTQQVTREHVGSVILHALIEV